MLPLVAFFIGFFPARGLLAVEKLATAAVKVLPQSQHQAEGLSMLPGMSYSHELRLGREGFDTVENLSHSAAVDLAVRTGFSYGQLEQWKGQSWLCSHLRDDYEAFIKRTAITSRDELKARGRAGSLAPRPPKPRRTSRTATRRSRSSSRRP